MSFRILSIVSIKATGFDSFVDLKQLLALCQGDLQVLHNWAQKTLWEDREIVLHAVQQNGLVLTEADEDFIYDMEVLQAAVKQNWTLPLNGNLL